MAISSNPLAISGKIQTAPERRRGGAGPVLKNRRRPDYYLRSSPSRTPPSLPASSYDFEISILRRSRTAPFHRLLRICRSGRGAEI